MNWRAVFIYSILGLGWTFAIVLVLLSDAFGDVSGLFVAFLAIIHLPAITALSFAALPQVIEVDGVEYVRKIFGKPVVTCFIIWLVGLGLSFLWLLMSTWGTPEMLNGGWAAIWAMAGLAISLVILDELHRD